MKKRILILGSLVAFVSIAEAQVWTTAAGQETTPGKVGIGTATPANKLDIDIGPGASADDGIQIQNSSSTGDPTILLNNLTAYNWKILSDASGRFSLSNTSSGFATLLGITSSGEIYGGPGSGPNGQFFINTSTQSSAIKGSCTLLNPIGTSGFAAGTGGAGSIARGILGNASSADDNQGGSFTASGGTTAKGVYGTANNGATNYGGYFETRGSGWGGGTPPLT